MKCNYKNRAEIITSYLTGELSEPEATSFEEHFFNCDDCFHELRLQQSTIDLIKSEGNILFREYLEKKSTLKENWFQRIVGQVQLPENRVRLIFATIVVIFIAAGLYFSRTSFKEGDILAKIEYSDEVPYQYNPVQRLRGPSDKQKFAQMEEFFFNQFQQSMLFYKDRNYKSAAQYLEDLETFARQLEAAKIDTKSLTILRDYYFYRGVAQFAVFRQQDSKLPKASQQQYLENAIESLSIANEMSQHYKLGDNDKVKYFLGLANGFAGNTRIAVQQLKAIQSEEPEFKYRSQLILLWTSK